MTRSSAGSHTHSLALRNPRSRARLAFAYLSAITLAAAMSRVSLAWVVGAGQENDTTPPPVAVIESVTADGEVMPHGVPIELPPNTGRLDIHYSAASHAHSGRVCFRYRLDGYDDGWIDAGSERTARYRQLPPGEFRFRLAASHENGAWSDSEVALRIRRLPHLYEATWFRLVCVSLALGLAIVVHFARLRSIQARNAALRVRVAKYKRAQEALRDREKQFAQVTDNIHQVVFLTDWIEPKLIYVSRAYERIFGRTCQSLYDDRRSWLDCVHLDDRHHVDTTFANNARDGKVTEEEYRIIRPDGEERWILDRAFPVCGENGNIIRFVGVAEDITHRKRIDSAIRLVAEGVSAQTDDSFFGSLVQHLASALNVGYAFVATVDPEEPIEATIVAVWGHDRFARNFSYELLGTPCMQVSTGQLCIHPRQVAKHFPSAKFLTELGIESYGAAPLIDSCGRTIGVLVVLDKHPMTEAPLVESLLQVFAVRAATEMERQQADQLLRKSEKNLNDFFENAAIGLHWVAPDGTVLRVNRAELEMLGYARAEYVGHHIAEFHENAEVIADILAKLARNETLHDYEASLRCKDGSVRDVLISSNALREDGQLIHTRCFTRDITERKRAEEELRQRDVEMAHSGRLVTLGEMTAGISHELNQPLSAIANFAAACRRNLSATNGDPSRLPRLLERIEDMADRAGGVIHRIRELSKKRRHISTSVDLKKLVGEMLDLVGPEMRAADIATRIEAAEALPFACADPVEIQQVLLNLLRNAMDAMRSGGHPPHELCVRISSFRSDEIDITVSDTGPGISSELADRIFDPFVTSKSEGLGIGLSISKRIIDGHGGRLCVASNPERGATFYVALPVVSEPENKSDRYQVLSQFG